MHDVAPRQRGRLATRKAALARSYKALRERGLTKILKCTAVPRACPSSGAARRLLPRAGEVTAGIAPSGKLLRQRNLVLADLPIQRIAAHAERIRGVRDVPAV